jgi:hypothetical protein
MGYEVIDARRMSAAERARLMGKFLRIHGVVKAVDEGPGGRHGMAASSWDELRAVAGGGRHLVMVALMERAGVSPYMVSLEREVYPVGTPANARLEIYGCWWEEMEWDCIVVPIEDRGRCERMLGQFGLRLANGIPVRLSSSDGVVAVAACRRAKMERLMGSRQVRSWFPIGDHPSVFTVEKRERSRCGTVHPVGTVLAVDLALEAGF